MESFAACVLSQSLDHLQHQLSFLAMLSAEFVIGLLVQEQPHQNRNGETSLWITPGRNEHAKYHPAVSPTKRSVTAGTVTSVAVHSGSIDFQPELWHQGVIADEVVNVLRHDLSGQVKQSQTDPIDGPPG